MCRWSVLKEKHRIALGKHSWEEEVKDTTPEVVLPSSQDQRLNREAISSNNTAKPQI